MSGRELNAIFSDDIRHEVGGKISYMGVYNAEMWVRSFPVTLPKFCISISVNIPAAVFTDSLILRIFKDDQVLYEAEILTRSLDAISAFHQEQAALGYETFNRVYTYIVFSPFTVEDACVIRARVTAGDGEELRTGAIRIKLFPEGTDDSL